MKSPVLIIAFNRPELLSKCIESIKQYAPTKVFVSCDGPRKGNLEDKKKISRVKKIIKKEIDWKCTVSTKYENKNLGCKYAVSSAIDWFFLNVTQGIILEDDCVASPDFFVFCDYYLSRYKTDEQVMHISGNNFLPNRQRKLITHNMFVSTLPHVWGWATWRRAWKKYDRALTEFQNDSKVIENYFPFSNPAQIKNWLSNFQSVSSGLVDTWDYQWVYACWRYRGKCINPPVNLVENIGFNQGASTHTKSKPWWWKPLENLSVSVTDLQTESEHDLEINYDSRIDTADYELLSPFSLAQLKFKFIQLTSHRIK